MSDNKKMVSARVLRCDNMTVLWYFIVILVSTVPSWAQFSPTGTVAGPGSSCTTAPENRRPECALEISCLDEPVQLGYAGGVCLRASCPGIVAILHRRADEASFRRRFFTYRHFSFNGSWEQKDQGMIEASQVRLRELFLVLPGDVIEFRMADSDCNARIDLRNLGYIKMGDMCELQRWLASQRFMEMPALTREKNSQSGSKEKSRVEPLCVQGTPHTSSGGIIDRIFSIGREIGLSISQ
jgi:hypothetical protein